MMKVFLCVLFFSVSLNLSGQNVAQPALGGMVDYDPALIRLFFDAEEIELLIAGNQQTNGTAVENAAKRINAPTKYITDRNEKANLATETDKKEDAYAFNSPNYVRGYIILASEHRKFFRTYELYEGTGSLIGQGLLGRKKSIRVPWSVEGDLNLMLYSNSGNTQSFQFSALP